MTEKFTGHDHPIDVIGGPCRMCGAQVGDLEPCPARVPRTDNPISENVRAGKERAWDIASKLMESKYPDLRHLAVQYIALWTTTRSQKSYNDMLEKLVPKKIRNELDSQLIDDILDDTPPSGISCIDGIYREHVYLGHGDFEVTEEEFYREHVYLGHGDFEVTEEECQGCETCNGWKKIEWKVPPEFENLWVYIDNAVISATYTKARTNSLGEDQPAQWGTDCWYGEALPDHYWKPYKAPDPPK